jgi:hypothetical protein
MTRAKNDPRESEKRPYAYATGVVKRRDKCLNADEITVLYRMVGWIGPRIRTRRWPSNVVWLP